MKSFCSSEDTIKKMDRQPPNWGKYLQTTQVTVDFRALFARGLQSGAGSAGAATGTGDSGGG